MTHNSGSGEAAFAPTLVITRGAAVDLGLPRPGLEGWALPLTAEPYNGDLTASERQTLAYNIPRIIVTGQRGTVPLRYADAEDANRNLVVSTATSLPRPDEEQMRSDPALAVSFEDIDSLDEPYRTRARVVGGMTMTLYTRLCNALIDAARGDSADRVHRAREISWAIVNNTIAAPEIRKFLGGPAQ